MSTKARKWIPWIITALLVQAQPIVPQVERYGGITAGKEDILAVVSTANYTKVPFELVDGLIFVKAELEGRQGNFILDTGAPSLIINDNNQQGKTEDWQCVTSDIQPRAITVNQFQWAGIEKRELEAITLDISHLEKTYKRKVLGVIGYQVFSDREILVNARTMQIVILDGQKNYLRRFAEPITTTGFDRQGHLPVIEARAGDKTYFFGFDSGCTANLLDEKLLDQLPEGAYRMLDQKQLLGFSGEPQDVMVISTSAFQLEYLPAKDTEYLVTSLAHLEASDIHVSGLLGYSFFKNLTFSINYATNQLNIWEIHDMDTGLTSVERGAKYLED